MGVEVGRFVGVFVAVGGISVCVGVGVRVSVGVVDGWITLTLIGGTTGIGVSLAHALIIEPNKINRLKRIFILFTPTRCSPS